MADGILHVTSVVNKIIDSMVSGEVAALGANLVEDDILLLANVRKNKHSFVLANDLLNMSDSLVSKKVRDKAESSESGTCEINDTEMSDILANLAKVSHLIKLPYNNCIFEKEQMSWAFEFVDGFIGRRLIYAYVNTNEEEYTFSLISMGYDTKDGAKYLALPNTFSIVRPHLLLSENPRDFLKTYGTHANVSDSANVDTYSLKIIGALLAMNSPKITKFQEAQMVTELGTSKKKPKRSKVVVVEVSKELRVLKKADDELEKDAERRGMRAHFVRGHFKTKPSGIYWWNAFVRGSGAVTEKPYAVKS